MRSSSDSCSYPITVVIADDHPLVREGLASILKSQSDIKVVAEATNGEETLEICNQHLPDVLLLDLRMPRKDGLQVMKELAARTLDISEGTIKFHVKSILRKLDVIGRARSYRSCY